jgi:hypothetical protein
MSKLNSGTGFSIELEEWTLKRRGTHEGLPLYESLGGKITAIAIVKEPAIEVGAILNDDDRTIIGPVMIPDLKIFRDVGPNGRRQNCYWYFSADTIAQLQKTFTGQIKIGH